MPPELTVRAFAEMLDLPMYEQLRILEEQKYPRQAPASFRVPYYRPALLAIRQFYAANNNLQVLHDAVTQLRASAMPASKIENNVRVIEAFERSREVRRQLTVRPGLRTRQTLRGVELRYAADLVGRERNGIKYILYNPRQAPLTSTVARTTLELVDWVLKSAGVAHTLNDLEFIDLADRGRLYRIRQVRRRTIQRANQNARAIVQIWAGI